MQERVAPAGRRWRRALFGTVACLYAALSSTPAGATGVIYSNPNPDINVCGSPCPIQFGTYDPAGATHFYSSVHLDTSDGVTQVVQEAAAYVGEGYEPMMAAAIAVTAFGSGQFASDNTRARLIVDYRVLPLPGQTLARNERVPVLIDYAMGYTLDGQGSVSAYARLVRSGDNQIMSSFNGSAQLLVGELVENYSSMDNPVWDPDLSAWVHDFNPDPPSSGSLSASIGYQQTHYLELSVNASGSAYIDPTTGESWNSEGEVIMDPWIRVDPNSGYAGIAQVVYKDTLGNWVPALQGVGSVPEPSIALLAVAGLAGVALGRRRHR